MVSKTLLGIFFTICALIFMGTVSEAAQNQKDRIAARKLLKGKR